MGYLIDKELVETMGIIKEDLDCYWPFLPSPNFSDFFYSFI